MTPMGRPKSRHKDLPPRMTARPSGGRLLYYYTGGKRMLPLGPDLAAAKRRWAELESGPLASVEGTFRQVAARYRATVLPTKGRKTQLEQDPQLDRLVAVFGAMPIADLRPADVAAYLEKRSAKVMANREIALLSHVYNRARVWGYTTGENPVRGVPRHRETARKVIVTDAMFAAVYAQADGVLQDAMDLALSIGQRVKDVLGARRSDIIDGHLQMRQAKTGKPLRIEITPDLQAIVDRATTRKRAAASLWLLANDDGSPLTYWQLRRKFDAAREAVRGDGKDEGNVALADWQFRDLRAKTASDMETLQRAQELLGHTSAQVTRRVYRRGEKVRPRR